MARFLYAGQTFVLWDEKYGDILGVLRSRHTFGRTAITQQTISLESNVVAPASSVLPYCIS